MYTEQRGIAKREESRILLTINILLFAAFIFLFFSFWRLQILKKNYYSTLSSRNIIREIQIKSPRGLIFDSNGKIVAENKLNFDLFLHREKKGSHPDTEKKIMKITGYSKGRIEKILKKYSKYPGKIPIPIKRGIPFKTAIFLESRSDEFSDLSVEAEPGRRYPYGKTGSHIIGYLSEISDKELKKPIYENYSPGELIGKSGIESEYESYLKGVDGDKTVIKDNLGQIRKVLNINEPVIGKSLHLTVDFSLQKYSEEMFGDYNGAVGVVDLRTGGIVAMVSLPDFSPGFFSKNFTPSEWKELVNDKNKPLHNRFTRGLYSPGSTFKIVMSVAGLSERKILPGTGVVCTGSAIFYKRVFHCWNRGGHGWMNLENALKNSCNIFFYSLGKKMDIDVIARYSAILGFGEKTRLDIPGVQSGILPTRAWKKKVYGHNWYPGETISVAIGGGMISATPLQLLKMISIVALRGEDVSFHLLDTVTDSSGVIIKTGTFKKIVPIKKEVFEKVIDGLYRCVNDGGTGRAAMVQGLDICGKTGTQLILSLENPNYKKLVKQRRFTPHSWFVSFAPRNNPKYAVVVFVENGGDAGKIAAPIAAGIYRRLFKNE